MQGAEALVSTLIPEDRKAAVPEVAVYLKEAVGNSTRIDYGTGKRLWTCGSGMLMTTRGSCGSTN